VAFALHATFRRIRVTGGSMSPTLRNGQRLLIARRAYRGRVPQRHDIVVLRHPDAPKRLVVKRVVGLPGEVVAMRRGHVRINGRRLDEPFVQEPARYRYGPVTVPPGRFIVLGDNRNHSRDSHFWGAVDVSAIVGKALVSYWPPGRITHRKTTRGTGDRPPRARTRS
jgi:signal peptidase I